SLAVSLEPELEKFFHMDDLSGNSHAKILATPQFALDTHSLVLNNYLKAQATLRLTLQVPDPNLNLSVPEKVSAINYTSPQHEMVYNMVKVPLQHQFGFALYEIQLPQASQLD